MRNILTHGQISGLTNRNHMRLGKFVAQHNLKSDRSIDDCWETFDKVIVNAEEKPQSIVTRNNS